MTRNHNVPSRSQTLRNSWVLVLAVIASIAACGSTPQRVSEPQEAGTIPFATRAVGDGLIEMTLNRVAGTFEREGACAWLVDDVEGSEIRKLIIFPHEYTSLDSTGAVWVHGVEIVEGQRYEGGGGELADYVGLSPAGLAQPIPGSCDGDSYFFTAALKKI